MNLSMHAITTAGTLRRNPRWVVGSRRAPAPPRAHSQAGREPLAVAGPGAEPGIGCGRRSALGNTRVVRLSSQAASRRLRAGPAPRRAYWRAGALARAPPEGADPVLRADE